MVTVALCHSPSCTLPSLSTAEVDPNVYTNFPDPTYQTRTQRNKYGHWLEQVHTFINKIYYIVKIIFASSSCESSSFTDTYPEKSLIDTGGHNQQGFLGGSCSISDHNWWCVNGTSLSCIRLVYNLISSKGFLLNETYTWIRSKSKWSRCCKKQEIKMKNNYR